MNIYETDRLLNEYLLFHYGSAAEVLPWDFGPAEALGFAERSVTVLLDLPLVPSEGATALDLGCAVGRSCYELAHGCERVIGIDYSQSFVNAAEKVRDSGEMPYRQHIEGRDIRDLIAKRPENADASRISFEQGDAMNLRADLGSFEVVHAANLLCRLPEPQKLIQRLPDLVKSGGQLLLTTPCTWLEEFTPAQNWPQGSTFEWLKESLSGSFELAEQVDLPFLIREHARKYQWSVALGTRWIRL
ncbi:methyltransferase domain-containing protein [Roseimicrobium sp. ORNL1]|uniref:methyltransferase domain-containing protein n=1 Tax=Roseimicrobium sp. ORNL1 TaxID=2711231 RepID=UPI0013E17769|nr:methyltransferase domain-containing protein [Roseimicrobium sp. ORNL1]QIF00111.1 methyltransferase domain-containing protein [Roseimicrobium sp. ORNL1]